MRFFLKLHGKHSSTFILGSYRHRLGIGINPKSRFLIPLLVPMVGTLEAMRLMDDCRGISGGTRPSDARSEEDLPGIDISISVVAARGSPMVAAVSADRRIFYSIKDR